MISFTLSLVALLLGYLLYGKFVEHVFGPDDRPTPAVSKADGIDYIAMSGWKIFMIQFLNIAGTGPIFGAIMGAWYGPVAYLWIVLGCIFAGAVHDYMSGMLSLRHGGVGLPELVGHYLGKGTRCVMLVFTVLLLVMVGVVFVYSPALILQSMYGSKLFWVVAIFIYYIIATMLPIDKIIGKIYPLFAFSLLFMAVALMAILYIKMPALPEIWSNLSDSNLNANPAWLGTDSFVAKNRLRSVMNRTTIKTVQRREVFEDAVNTLRLTEEIEPSDAMQLVGTMKERIERMAYVILAETNVKELRFIEDGNGMQLVKKVKCNFRTMGKKFGKLMKSVNAAVMAMSQEQIAQLEQNGKISLLVDGQNADIEVADVEIISEDIPGWTIAQDGKITVALDIEITPELKNEGIARLIIKRIQAMRKDSGFEITDRINVILEDNEQLAAAVKVFGDHIAAQVLANSIAMGDASEGVEAEFGDFNAKIIVTKA